MSISKPALLLILLLQTGASFADLQQPSTRLPPVPQTVEEAIAQQTQADAMRANASQGRKEAEAIRIRDNAACEARWLVNYCREKVRKAYVTRMQVVRQLEIDANQIDRIAKSRVIEIESAQKNPPSPGATPLPAKLPQPGSSQPASPTPSAGGSPVTPPPMKTPPPATASAAAEAAAAAERARKAAEADQAMSKRQREAAERAAKAQADRERYDKRLREHEAKKAAKAAASAPN